MCQVCVAWEKGKLTASEALRNLDEIEFDIQNTEELDHYLKILEKVSDKKTS